MPDPATLTAFVLAAALVAIVPGPSVTIIAANALRYGAAAGMRTVAGTQVGVAGMILVLMLGLTAVVSAMGSLFEVLRLVGAAYLIWLGIKMWRSDGRLSTLPETSVSGRSFFWQGLVVVWSNPKALLFFGAFIPQFIDPAGNAVLQVALFGTIFMVVAGIGDSLYALAAGGAGALMTRTRVRIVERIAGTCMIGGGLWLALARR